MHSKLLLVLFSFTTLNFAFGQADSLYVNGRFIYNNHQQQLILKGVNYSVLDDWDFPSNMNNGGEKLVEIEKSGANAVRIQWYNNYGNSSRPAYTLANLDSLLTRSARYKMIPIVGLWDVTCNNDWTVFNNNITAWLTQPAVVALFNKHKRYSIINPANEFGYYQWASNPATALQTFKNNYKTLITTLRNAGYKIPIMIDAPDCGTNADALLNIGAELVSHDPLHNVIVSVHTYWQGYLNNDVTLMSNKLTQMEQSGLPFFLGEVANYQSDATACQYALNYQNILTTATNKNIGWLAWGWYKDYCNLREMTPTGLYNNLGGFGLDIVNNTTYGLKPTAIKNSLTFLSPTTVLSNSDIKLTANCSQNKNTKLLVTLTNTNAGNLYFQSSIDGNNWQTFLDTSITTEKNISITAKTLYAKYYRVKLITKSGLQNYSNTIFCASTTSIFYPNPASESITISHTNTTYQKAEIYNSKGGLVQTLNILNNKINTSNLPTGVYAIKLITANHQFYNTTLFIKK